jgi:hypothetical protein
MHSLTEVAKSFRIDSLIGRIFRRRIVSFMDGAAGILRDKNRNAALVLNNDGFVGGCCFVKEPVEL